MSKLRGLRHRRNGVRHLRCLLAAALAVAALAPAAEAAEFVGLGDSYSSGNGTASSYPGENCVRNNLPYPALIGPQLAPGSWANLSCSGARTHNITSQPQAPDNPIPQVQDSRLGADTRYVTLTVGGNDAGFVDTLVACANPFSNCTNAVNNAIQKAQTELPPKLAATYTAVRAKAPNAMIAIVGYPRIFRPNQGCNTFFTAGEVNLINHAADVLSEEIRGVAHAHDLAYVDVIPAFIGHGVCDNVEWINRFHLIDVPQPNWYHPKAIGHANGYAPTVLSAIQAIPDTSITTAPASPSPDDVAEIEFTATATATSFQCKLDAGAYEPCTSPTQYSDLSEGSHTVQVRAVNSAGNVDQFPAMHTWTIDLTAPEVSITDAPAGSTNSTDASFEFEGSDNHTPAAGLDFECRLDPTGGPEDGWSACESPETYGDLGEGDHSFEVRATDEAGNTGAPASHDWEVDLTAPVVTLDPGSLPADVTTSTGASFAFEVDDESAVVECRLDPAGGPEDDWEACASPSAHTELDEGPHSFEVRATDAAGNVGAASHAWTVDLTAPEVSITDAPAGSTNSTDASFEFEGSDNHTPVAELAFECRLDPAPGGGPEDGWSACESPETYGDLGEGEHSFEVRATDEAGNTGAPASHDWEVDLTAPVVTLDPGSLPADATTSAEASFAFEVDDGSAVVECRLDPAGGPEDDWEACASPSAHTELDEGPHSFEVRATDAAGNVGAASHAWEIDLTAPVVTLDPGSLPADPTNSTDASFEFEGSDNHTPVAELEFECRLYPADGPEDDWESCVSPSAHPGLADDRHRFEVRATDAAGNTGEAESHEWEVDTTPPLVTIVGGPPPNQAVASQAAELSFTVTGADAGPAQCSLDGAAFAPCSSPELYSGLSQGERTFTVRSTDPAGNVGSASRTWTVDTQPPVITITSAPESPTLAREAGFEFSADEPAEFKCSLDGALRASCESPVTFEGLADGNHFFRIWARDALGNETLVPASHQWRIGQPDEGRATRRPVISFRKAVRPLRRPVVATVRCLDGPCAFTRRTARLRLRGRALKVKLAAPRSIPSGRAVRVRVVLGKRARRALRSTRRPRLALRLAVRSTQGPTAAARKLVRLRRG